MLLLFLPKGPPETSALAHLSCLELCLQQRIWQLQVRPSILIYPLPILYTPSEGQHFPEPWEILITAVIQLSGAKSFITFSVCVAEPFIMYCLWYWLRVQKSRSTFIMSLWHSHCDDGDVLSLHPAVVKSSGWECKYPSYTFWVQIQSSTLIWAHSDSELRRPLNACFLTCWKTIQKNIYPICLYWGITKRKDVMCLTHSRTQHFLIPFSLKVKGNISDQAFPL